MHNYIKKIDDLASSGAWSAIQLQHVRVLHDDWCAVYRESDCDCDPDIKMMCAICGTNDPEVYVPDEKIMVCVKCAKKSIAAKSN